MARHFSRTSIDELEAAFDRKRSDSDFLAKLIDELSHRTTSRAGELKARATYALGTAGGTTGPSRSTSTVGRQSAQPSAASSGPAGPMPHGVSATPEAAFGSAQRGPMPPISNSPTAILSAW